MSYHSKVGHLASALSVVDILVTLYFFILKTNCKKPKDENRDRFILSKGHVASALYAILSKKGFFPANWLETYCQDNGKLGTHPDHYNVPGIEWTTGSLGHGLSVACGIALGLKLKGSPRRVFALISDAESQEGEIWEAALTAAHHKLQNLTVILDFNNVQAFGNVKDVLNLEPITDKWKSFGWRVVQVNGHDLKKLIEVFSLTIANNKQKPTIIIAHTIRGKGIAFMENKMEWYYNYPTVEDYKEAIRIMK